MATVTCSVDGPIARLAISRPERRNALDQRGVDELHEAVRRVAAGDVRVLVVTGDADHFCAGADLTELEDPAFTRSLRAVLDDLASLPFPTVAAISGACMGLGTQIALSCDLRLATADARFAVPVAKLGLMVDHWTVERLALLAGHSTARWMLLTAEAVTAAEAHRVGLVHRLVDVGDGRSPGTAAQAAADELAAGIARLAPLSLAGSKLGLDLLQRSADELDVAGGYRRAFDRAWASDDLVEGRRAFTERRPAQFRGG